MLSMMFLSTILVPILNENGATFKILGLLILRRNINLFISVIMAGTITAAPTVQGTVVEPAAEAAQVNVAEATSQEQNNNVFDFGIGDITVVKGSIIAARIKDLVNLDGFTRFEDLVVTDAVVNFRESGFSDFAIKFRNAAAFPQIDKDGNKVVHDRLYIQKALIIQAMNESGYAMYTSLVKDVYNASGMYSESEKEANKIASDKLAAMLTKAKLSIIAKGFEALASHTNPYTGKEVVSERRHIKYYIVDITFDDTIVEKALAL